MSTKATEGMIPLSKDEAQVFERRLAMAREQLEEIDGQIAETGEDAKSALENPSTSGAADDAATDSPTEPEGEV